MKVIHLPGAQAPKHLYATTLQGQREKVVRLVIAPAVFGAWSLIAHFPQPGHGHRLQKASLRTIILIAEKLKAQYPDIELDTGYLSPEGVRGYEIEDVWCNGQWATGKRRQPRDFANAQELYLHLREGFYQDGAYWVKAGEGTRTRLYRSYWMIDSHRAWDIAEYRIEHPEATSCPDLDLPEGTCECCLSRYVAIPDHGVGYHCLECGHEPQER